MSEQQKQAFSRVFEIQLQVIQGAADDKRKLIEIILKDTPPQERLNELRQFT